ncbi:MAG: hypothetical protein U0939_14325 [Pirellulales bacterium]
MIAAGWLDSLWPLFTERCLQVGDLLLGWSLAWTPEAAVVLAAIASWLLFRAARRCVISGDRLERAYADLRTLRRLRREAVERDDCETRSRLDRTAIEVRLLLLRSDLQAGAIAALPLLGLAVWCHERLTYCALGTQPEVQLIAVFPLHAIDHYAHLVPQDDLATDSGWIARIEIDPTDRSQSRAVWRLRCLSDSSRGERLLEIRHRGSTATHRLRWGDAYYNAPRQLHAAGPCLATMTPLREFRFAGIVPWHIAYLGLLAVGQASSLSWSSMKAGFPRRIAP